MKGDILAMDNVQVLIQAISTVGFPIAMCCIMAYYVKYTEDKHREELNSIREALENNTLALTVLSEKMDRE